ncbi:MAG: CotH kinase family protein [Bacteroidota bacterium]
MINKFTKILCFVVAIFQFNCSKAQLSNGDIIFYSNQIHSIYLQFNQTGWWDSLIATHSSDTYLQASGTFDGVAITNIGVKTKGNSSFNNPSNKKSMKIDFDIFDSTLAWDGLTKINLNNGFKDPTFLREKIALDFMNDHGVSAPRCTYANVYLNNQLWGLYMLVEEVDKKFLKDRFDNKDGNLFKGDPHGDLSYLGASATPYYNNYELHTNGTTNDWSDLILLTNTINNSPTVTLESSLDTVLDLQVWYRLWAANILFANMDSYQGSGHNYYIYHNTDTDKFDWITWDVNESFGCFQNGLSLSQIKALSPDYIPTTGMRPLEQKCLANTNMKCDYYTALHTMLLSGFDTGYFNPMIDSLADWVRTSVYADPNKFFTNQNFESNLTTDMGNTPGLKSFIPERINAVLPVVLASGCDFSSSINSDLLNSDLHTVTLYPNPAGDELFISAAEKIMAVEIFDLSGREIFYQTTDKNNLSINLQTLSSGIYFLKTKSDDGVTFMKKFVRQ